MDRSLGHLKRFRLTLTTAVFCSLLTGSALASEPIPSGECVSPRDSILQLLYYVQPGRTEAAAAAVCINWGSEVSSPERAVVLKKALDLKNFILNLEAIPGTGDYTDADSGASEYTYFPRLFPEFVASKQEDGRWLLSASALPVAEAWHAALVPFDMAPLLQHLPSAFLEPTLGIYPWQLLGILVLGILSWFLQILCLQGLSLLGTRQKGGMIEKLVEAVRKPMAWIAAAYVFTIFLPVIQFPVHLHAALMFLAQLAKVWGFIGLGLNGANFLADRLAQRAELTESKLDDQLVPLVRKLLKVFVVIFGGIVVLHQLNVDVASLIAGLGIGGLAFALAAKDTIANLFGSLTVFVDKPFQVGDAISIGGSTTGVVEEVGFRSVRIRTFDKTLITLPNGMLTNSVVENLTERLFRRYKTVLGLTYDTTAEQVTAFCEGVEHIIEAMPDLNSESKTVEFTGFGDSALEILVVCHMNTPDYGQAMRTQHNFNLAVLQLAEDLGVGFAFPTQSLHLESTPESRGSSPAITSPPMEIARSYGAGETGFEKLQQRGPLDPS